MLPQVTPGEDLEARRPPARSRRRRLRRRLLRWGVPALLLLAVALAVDTLWVATTAAREVRSLRDRLATGAELLEGGRVEEAEMQFLLAERAAQQARSALSHPSALIAAMIPGLSDDVEAVRALATASEEVARAGSSLSAAARAAGWDGESVPAMRSGGSFDTAAIRSTAADLAAASDAIASARRALAPIRTDGLFDLVRDAVKDGRAQLASRGATVERAARLATLLPPFLGDPEPRRYLLIAQNLSDPRGSGGYLGSYGVLEVRGGRITLGRIAPAGSLPEVDRVDAPAEVASRYARFGALTRTISGTYPPDFPTAARLLLAQWEAGGEAPLDGVVSVDAVWMAYVLEAIGPVGTPAWPEPIAAGNVTDVVGRRTFLAASNRESNALQGAIATALWRALLERPPQARTFGEATVRAVAERHLQVYAVRRDEQATLGALGATGSVDPGPNPLMVSWFGAVDSRTGYFAEKDISYEARLLADGTAEVVLTATLWNRAPDRPASILLGDGGDVPVGYYAAFVSVYLPPGATVSEIRGGSLALQEREFGAPVVMGLLSARSGGSARLRVTYTAGPVTDEGDGERRFELDVIPQPALRPDAVRVVISLPPGSTLLALSGQMASDAGTLVWEATPVVTESLWVRYR